MADGTISISGTIGLVPVSGRIPISGNAVFTFEASCDDPEEGGFTIRVPGTILVSDIQSISVTARGNFHHYRVLFNGSTQGNYYGNIPSGESMLFTPAHSGLSLLLSNVYDVMEIGIALFRADGFPEGTGTASVSMCYNA